MTTPLPYQLDGAWAIHKFKGRALLADEMGLGKTFQALYYCKKKPAARPIIVVCPAHLKYNWENEAKMHVGYLSDVLEGRKPPRHAPFTTHPLLIINYEILHWWVDYLVKMDPAVVIIDECFPAGTLVDTSKGPKPIEQIEEGEWVRNADGFGKVVQTNCRLSSSLVRLWLENGYTIDVTPNHPFFTEQGWVPAARCAGRQLHTVLSMLDLGQGCSISKPHDPNEMRVVRQDVEEEKSFLRHILLSEMEGSPSACERVSQQPRQVQEDIGATSSGPSQKSSVEGNAVGTNEESKPLQSSGSETEGQREVGSNGPPTCQDEKQRRQRPTPTTPSPDAEGSSRRGMGDGACDSNPPTIPVASLLQSGSSTAGEDDRGRAGWMVTHSPNREEAGSEEGSIPGRVRVVRVEVLEQGSGWEPSGCSVYNLQVSGHPSYFAGGVLVHNCQYIKNPSSRRYKAVKKLVAEADIPHRIALSGTPLTNRPSELWAVLSIIRPDLYPSFIEYADLYCAPRLAPWGMDYSGARHLGHLHRQLLKECMIRRLKVDVLKDLPPKIPKVIPVEIENRQEYEYAEAHFLRWLSEQSLARAKRAKRAVAITKVSYLMRLAARLKVPVIKQWIDDFKENTDEKLVVYSMHRPMIELLERRYHSECVRVDGSVTGRARQARVDQFQKDPSTRFFFGQGRAASTGLTLTAACNTLWTDFPWSPDVLDQADDRVHRIGQTRTVWNHYLVARNTIEDRVCSFLSTKKGILGEVLDGLSAGDNTDIFDALLTSLTTHG